MKLLSDEYSSTAPWCFFIIFLFFCIPLKGEKIMIECVDKVMLFISSSLSYMTYLVIALVVCKLLISNRASY